MHACAHVCMLSIHCSFDEHSLIDLPDMVDYVLEVTNQSELFYVGHSQGTVMGFAGFSSLPDLASKIKLFVALAPVTTVHYIKGAFDFISYFYKEVEVSLPVPHSSVHSPCIAVVHNTMYCILYSSCSQYHVLYPV